MAVHRLRRSRDRLYPLGSGATRIDDPDGHEDPRPDDEAVPALELRQGVHGDNAAQPPAGARDRRPPMCDHEIARGVHGDLLPRQLQPRRSNSADPAHPGRAQSPAARRLHRPRASRQCAVGSRAAAARRAAPQLAGPAQHGRHRRPDHRLSLDAVRRTAAQEGNAQATDATHRDAASGGGGRQRRLHDAAIVPHLGLVHEPRGRSRLRRGRAVPRLRNAVQQQHLAGCRTGSWARSIRRSRCSCQRPTA